MVTRIAIFLLSAVTALAVDYYVDSDWSGTQSGTQAQPWRSINWTTINTSLASGAVNVYFSARQAGSNTDDNYDTSGGSGRSSINLDGRTDTSSNRLTIDGCSFYNTNDTTPSWSSYAPTPWTALTWAQYGQGALCTVNNINSQSGATTRRSNITIRGFRIVCNTGDKLVSVSGSNVIVEYCDGTATTSGGGPGFMMTPTADADHEGSSEPVLACDNVIWRYNYVHNNQGEGFYIGGAAHRESDDQPGGYPSHTNITVLGNYVVSPGNGGQGDGVDIKAGMTNVIIRNNNLTAGQTTGDQRAIVAQGNQTETGGLIIDGNLIYTWNVDEAAIALANSWGVPKSVVITNNIIYNTTGGGGFHQYDSQNQTLIANNTIYNNASAGISNDAGSVKLRNNWVFNNTGNEVALSGTITSNYNAFASGTWGYGGEGANSVTTTTASLTNPASADFTIPGGSPLIGAGESQSGVFTIDFNGATRSTWDIGAIKATSTPPAPTIDCVRLNATTLHIGL